MVDYTPIAPTTLPMTADEYFAAYPEETTLPQELLEGEVFIMPAPHDSHQAISSHLLGFLWMHIQPQGLGQLRHAPTDVEFDDYNVAQPDIFFVAKDSPRCVLTEGGKRWQGAPDLCIEILSPSTAKRDMETKFALYERHGVREYWVVDVANQYISVYGLADGHFQRQGVYGPADTLQSLLLSGLAIPMANLFMKA